MPYTMFQTIVYVIHDLCLHPEYIEPLRNELKASYAEFEHTGRGLPLLDSFIKESARLTPVESSKSSLALIVLTELGGPPSRKLTTRQ